MNQRATTNYLIIGDIHGCAPAYFDALGYAFEHKLTPVFLGDLWDYRSDVKADNDDAAIFADFRDNRYLLLKSNHQQRMRKFVLGHKIKSELGKYTERTVEALDFAFGEGEWHADMLGILDRGTYTLKLCNKYCLAHAFYPNKALTNPCLNSRNKQLAVYGERGIVTPWWLDKSKQLPEPYVRVSGHYHNIYSDEHSIVLDGNCGSQYGRLFGFRTDTAEVVRLWEER